MRFPLTHDPWLSGVLEKETWRLDLDEVFIRSLSDNRAFRDAFRKLQEERVFIYCKVSTTQLAWVQLLEEQGFHLIDTNVNFAHPIHDRARERKRAAREIAVGEGWEIRFAKIGDEEDTKTLAGNCFCYSRFHLDPAITRERADTIKAQWAGNYFRRKRGDFMILAIKDGFVAGFLQLFRQERTLIIDLIGVHENFRGIGIGCMLIDYAEIQCGDFDMIRVGTQIANASSIRFYEKQGFRVVESSYVFHFHGKDSGDKAL